MPLFVLHWDDDPNFKASDELRQQHLAYFMDRADKVVFGVAQTNDQSQSVGRTVVVDVATRKDAEDFLYNEPLFKAGKTKTSKITFGRIVQQRAS